MAQAEQPEPRWATTTRPSRDGGRHLGQARGDVLVGQAVEAVAAHARAVELLRDGVAVGELGVAAVEGGVEAGDLRQPGPAGADRADRRQVVRLVERGERHQRLELLQERVVDQHRGGVVRAAVHDPVADRDRRGAQVLEQPAAEHLLRPPDVGGLLRRDLPVDGLAALGVLRREPRPRRADALDLAPEQPGQVAALPDPEELELDARAAGVEDQDGVRHRLRPPPASSGRGGGRRAPPPRRTPSASGRCPPGWSG